MSIYQMINEIDSKEIVLPAIQRDFVWDTDRIRLLFDSIMRGYPVGIVLLWETYQPIQFRYFDSTFVPDSLHQFYEHNGKHRIKLVLDGQQRLSSIYVALKGKYNNKGLYLDVLSGSDNDDFSEEKYDFSFFTTEEVKIKNETSVQSVKLGRAESSKVADEKLKYYVHIRDIVGRTPNDLLKFRQTISDTLKLCEVDKLRMETNLLTLSHALTGDEEILKTQTIDSKLPSDDHKRKSAFDILEIFVRINTVGVRLSRSDLIVSMLRLYWQEASDVLPAFVKEINEGSGLDIDNDFVIRCMFATAGIGTRLDFELLRKQSNVDKIRASYKTCFTAIRAVVDFVRSECHVDSSRLIGGISTLVPFVQFLYHAPKQSFPVNNRVEARRSLYLFAFSKVFTQFSESRTGAFIRNSLPSASKIRAGEPFSYDNSLRFVNSKSNFDPSDDRLFANNPELALALIQQKSGGKVKYSDNLPEIDHIFPQATLRDKNLEWDEINDLGNLWILPRTMNRNKSATHPKEYLGKKAEKEYLEVALIDLEKLDLRLYKTFIRNRREAISRRLRKLTGINETDLSTLEDRTAQE
jgi:hypothetical protein